MGCAQFARVMEMTSTRNSRSVDKKLLKLAGHGMSYAVLPDARIYSESMQNPQTHQRA